MIPPTGPASASNRQRPALTWITESLRGTASTNCELCQPGEAAQSGPRRHHGGWAGFGRLLMGRGPFPVKARGTECHLHPGPPEFLLRRPATVTQGQIYDYLSCQVKP